MHVGLPLPYNLPMPSCFPRTRSTLSLHFCSYVLGTSLLPCTSPTLPSPGDTFDHQSGAVVTHGVVLLQAFPLQTVTLPLTTAPLSLVCKISERRMLPLYAAREGGKSLRVWPDFQLRNSGNSSLIFFLPGSTETTLLLPTKRRLRAEVEAILRIGSYWYCNSDWQGGSPTPDN